ncbi:unnamed protein product [Cylicocyclus nassatus]|uniref:Uncharacterized protein n=1 Tax=Cylicocyclus nassatus TaxID=53992 RepID=A0AA36DV83_CYLNA|nr:unnamed protein product [Cylicocyclus nassatus]
MFYIQVHVSDMNMFVIVVLICSVCITNSTLPLMLPSAHPGLPSPGQVVDSLLRGVGTVAAGVLGGIGNAVGGLVAPRRNATRRTSAE